MLIGKHTGGGDLTRSPDGAYAIGGIPTTVEFVKAEDAEGRIQWVSAEGRGSLGPTASNGEADASPATAHDDRRPGWFTRLKGWQKVLFVLVWPVSAGYGIYWMWKQQRFTQPVRIALSLLFAVVLVASVIQSAQNRREATSARVESQTTSSAQTSEGVQSQPPSSASPVPTPTQLASAPSTSSPPPAPAQPTQTQATAAPEAPGDTLLAQIRAKLGASNRGVERVPELKIQNGTLDVTFATNQNVTDDLIVMGAKISATQILELVQGSGAPIDTVRIAVTFSMQDKLGNASEQRVVYAEYPKATISKINFKNFAFKNIWEISSSSMVHPAFK